MENATFEKLKERLAEVIDLNQALAILTWDQEVMMPKAGAALRANQRATVTKVLYERFTAEETGRLLEELRGYEESLDPESDDASLIRVARRHYEKAVRVPPELRGQISRANSEGVEAWGKAKDRSDFGILLPALEHAFELRRRYVECFEGFDEPYDVLLDDFEPDMKTAEVREVFAVLKEELRPLIRAAAAREIEDDFLTGDFDVEPQRALSSEIVELFGLRPGTWRLDPTRHPFVGGPGTDDVRITTYYREHDLEWLFATMHEYGHALYENQLPRRLARTLAGTAASYGVHESQSRMWENLVGRGRPFWNFYYPRLQAAFPQFGEVDLERFFQAINVVKPSLIRIMADEVTYNMHIILRFELEQDLLEGRVDLRDLPEIWNQRMWEYLEVEVPRDAEGVLQDMHWGGGHIGYFATYSLGNVMSVQIWEKIRDELPDLDEQIERGEFAPLREWLGERLHTLGRKFTPQETLERVTGSRLDPKPYLRYLEEKHGARAA